jgi:hypothetical protein
MAQQWLQQLRANCTACRLPADGQAAFEQLRSAERPQRWRRRLDGAAGHRHTGHSDGRSIAARCFSLQRSTVQLLWLCS